MSSSNTPKSLAPFSASAGQEVSSFLKAYSNTADHEGRDEDWKVKNFPRYLHGEPLEYYEGLSDREQGDWHLLRRAMTKAFGPRGLTASREPRTPSVSRPSTPSILTPSFAIPNFSINVPTDQPGPSSDGLKQAKAAPLRSGRIRFGDLGSHMMRDIKNPYGCNADECLVVHIPDGEPCVGKRFRMKMEDASGVQDGYGLLGICSDGVDTYIFDACNERNVVSPNEQCRKYRTGFTTVWILEVDEKEGTEELRVELAMKGQPNRRLDVYEEVTRTRRGEVCRFVLKFETFKETDREEVTLKKTRMFFEP